MTMTLTLIDDTYSSNESSGRKLIFGSVSCTNPYTAVGDLITISTYFKSKFLGGFVGSVNASVTAALAGLASSAKFRGDTSSFTTAVIGLWQTGLSGTASAGLWVDNTTGNISATTFVVGMYGY